MQSIRQVTRLNDAELASLTAPTASWHTDYRDTAYIYIGGLPFELSEGDILAIFSQYGNPAHINLVRDKETGQSRGFCFLKYEDQRSCDLAVDNLSGAGVMGRVVSVDHTRYKRKEGEVEGLGDEQEEEEGEATDREDGRGKRRKTESGDEAEEQRPLLKEEVELAKLLREHDEDDPMKAYLVKEKRAEVEEALKRAVVQKKEKGGERKHKHHHRSRRREDEDEDKERRHKHRSRRDRDEDDEERRRRRHRSHRSRSADSDDGHARRKHRSRKDESDGEGDRQKRSPDEDRSKRRERSPIDRLRSRSRDRRDK